ncbi:MAG: hypothetical protein DU429_02320 [Candidatus Tokpelaia sp.]|uniref:SH3 domain-containing protein n=1 Tax=Candidatus Tokpelaia sp. TaxID=2233777 RepID=UPI00123B3AB7|nr:SH3 domain-containing protein [Candidatus Tokpelaia sp.]KAA6207475.1 MAG: hypothetical protein DU429_02320 [Candidatus Tokpelaia sp.]KAA6405248.1 hypothetical protein DPQ22_06340 [Candidatus Tokpelaia sp.]
MHLGVFFPLYKARFFHALRTGCALAAVFLPLARGPALSGQALAKTAAEGSGAATIGPSGLPLPRFVTLKSSRVNMRIGPDQNKYPISWSYRRQGLPVEIVQEYDNWRRIRDSSGTTGWVNAALLAGKRAAIIAPQRQSGLLPLYAEANSNSAVIIEAEPGVIGALRHCNGQWCELEIEKKRGYIQQNLLWGVYPREVIK